MATIFERQRDFLAREQKRERERSPGRDRQVSVREISEFVRNLKLRRHIPFSEADLALRNELKKNKYVALDEQNECFSFKKPYDISNKQELLQKLKEEPDGMLINDIAECYTGAKLDAEDLVNSRKVIGRGRKGIEILYYPPQMNVDQEAADLWSYISNHPDKYNPNDGLNLKVASSTKKTFFGVNPAFRFRRK